MGGLGEEKGVSSFLLAKRLEERGVKRKLREPEDRACLFLEGHRTRQASRRRSILGTLHPGVSLPVRLGS